VTELADAFGFDCFAVAGFSARRPIPSRDPEPSRPPEGCLPAKALESRARSPEGRESRGEVDS
jgi:hypothetical protein